ncbi:hypothetical protein U91I_03813 [alpha proteobacterium U9-1i]|nr:hypothetical protein U91I_03813 [alpha proteobacterium U9-1i]
MMPLGVRGLGRHISSSQQRNPPLRVVARNCSCRMARAAREAHTGKARHNVQIGGRVLA